MAPLAGKLGVAVLLAFFIGWERERHDRPAGLRTHILVCLGSALLTVVSESYGDWGDPARISAQIVSGIGFLGAGTIMRHGSVVRGLTTAASLWTVAAIGMAVGRGGIYLLLATFVTLVVYLVLSLLNRLEGRLPAKREWRDLVLRYEEAQGRSDEVVDILSRHRVEIETYMREDAAEGLGRQTRFRLRMPTETVREQVLKDLMARPWVREAQWV